MAGEEAAPSRDPEANALLERGDELLARSDPRTGGSLGNAREAIELYRRALARDPELAVAHVRIARAWRAQGYSNPDAPPPEEIERRSRDALERALALDPDLPEAHQLLAAIHYTVDHDWAAAEREFRWAIEHAPRDAAAHAGLAAFLATMGRFDEALREAAIAERLRGSPADVFNRARILYSMRDHEAAIAACRQALAAQENQAFRFYLGLMLIAAGRVEEGVAELEHASGQGDNAGAALGLAYGRAVQGRPEEALRLIERVRSTHAPEQVVPYRLAAVHLALGDLDSAIAELRRDYEGHGNWTVQLKVDPVMDPLRADPRFQQLMRELAFPPVPPGASPGP